MPWAAGQVRLGTCTCSGLGPPPPPHTSSPFPVAMTAPPFFPPSCPPSCLCVHWCSECGSRQAASRSSWSCCSRCPTRRRTRPIASAPRPRRQSCKTARTTRITALRRPFANAACTCTTKVGTNEAAHLALSAALLLPAPRGVIRPLCAGCRARTAAAAVHLPASPPAGFLSGRLRLGVVHAPAAPAPSALGNSHGGVLHTAPCFPFPPPPPCAPPPFAPAASPADAGAGAGVAADATLASAAMKADPVRPAARGANPFRDRLLASLDGDVHMAGAEAPAAGAGAGGPAVKEERAAEQEKAEPRGRPARPARAVKRTSRVLSDANSGA
jgi:hypothetical protein